MRKDSRRERVSEKNKKKHKWREKRKGIGERGVIMRKKCGKGIFSRFIPLHYLLYKHVVTTFEVY